MGHWASSLLCRYFVIRLHVDIWWENCVGYCVDNKSFKVELNHRYWNYLFWSQRLTYSKLICTPMCWDSYMMYFFGCAPNKNKCWGKSVEYCFDNKSRKVKFFHEMVMDFIFSHLFDTLYFITQILYVCRSQIEDGTAFEQIGRISPKNVLIHPCTISHQQGWYRADKRAITIPIYHKSAHNQCGGGVGLEVWQGVLASIFPL